MGSESDEVIRMDPADDKTGERRKSAFLVVGSAVAGALLGDVFAVRDHEIVGEVTYTYNGNEYTNTWTFENKESGGVFDIWRDDYKIQQIRDTIENNGGTVISDTMTYHPESTIGGFIGGGLGGYGADYLRKRLKKRKEEE